MNKVFYYKSNKIEVNSNDLVIKNIVENHEIEKAVLLFGEVQSGKTRQIIRIISSLFKQDKIDYVFYITGNTNSLKEQNFTRFHKDEVLDKIDIHNIEKSFFKRENLEYDLKEDKKIFTLVKQNIVSMTEMINKYLSNKRVLIIDDESDDYSTSDENSRNIIEVLKNKGTKLISCTATPFLNLILFEDIYDNFYKLKPYDEYCGRKDFFDNYKSIRNFNNKSKLLYFVILKWIHTIKENNINDSQLLINAENKNKVHFIDKSDIFLFNEILPMMKEELKSEFKKMTGINLDIEYCINFLNEIISKGNVKVINGKKDSDKLENKGYEIIIGGILLSRGITYENLLFEIFINVGKEKTPAHTLIQRSRWFGDRGEFKDLMEIYMEDKTIESFHQINDLYDKTLNYNLGSHPNYAKSISLNKERWNKIKIGD